MAALLVIIVLLIAAIAVTGRVQRRRLQEPACAACGYAVRGLSRTICPECGADILKAGVIGRGRVHGSDLIMESAGFLLAAFLLTVCAAALLQPIGPHWVGYRQAANFQCRPALGTYRLEMQAVASAVTWKSDVSSLPVGSMEIRFVPGNTGPQSTLELDVTELNQHIGRQPPNPIAGELSALREQIAVWLRTLPGVPEDRVEDHVELLSFAVSVAGDMDAVKAFNDERVMRSLEQEQQMPALVFAGGGGGGGTTRHPVVAGAILAFFLVLWAAWSTIRLVQWHRLRALDRSGATWAHLRE